MPMPHVPLCMDMLKIALFGSNKRPSLVFIIPNPLLCLGYFLMLFWSDTKRAVLLF